MTITEELDAQPVYQRRHTWAYTEMLISSLLGLVASLVLSIDAVALAANPDVDLSCNINEKISCGAVGLTWQANLLGFPNAFLGLIAEPVVITVATAALGGVRFPRWFMITAQVIYSIGLAFAYWLFYEAYFVIGALCPWCLLITVTTTLVFMSMTRVNLLDGNLGVRLQEWSRKPLSYGADIAGTLLIIAVIAAMVIARYA
ncbi:MAG: vitamin K epoxide reductase family protein [Candidatus Nanopelagicales bacterium]|nr:vitamin K epoxide reductase family protein [Candidatus Nanopelagicales bacterium]